MASTGTAPLLTSTDPVIGIPVAPVPVSQSMVRTLTDGPGLVYRERIYLSQVFCQACEKKTSFAIGAYPGDAQGPHSHVPDETILSFLRTMWMGEVREESSCLCRYCCHQNRELKLGFFAPASLGVIGGAYAEGGFAGYGWPEGQAPELVLDRPFRCTLCCCCCLLNPQEMSAEQEGRLLGRTVQQCKPCPCRCFPFEYAVLDEADHAVYTVQVPAGCDNGCVNCCAPSCFNKVYVLPILDAKTREQVGSIENHWPGCNVRGICLAGMANNNYVIKWPSCATAEHKCALLSAAHLIDLNVFEQRANQRN